MPYELPYDELPDELLCPSCGRISPPSERFCESCGMPLVQPEGEPQRRLSESRRRARKINPLYTEGRPVKVARAANLVQAEFIAGMLLEEGIPCMLDPRSSIIAVYAPVAGARDVLVPESALEAAREVLTYSAPGAPPAAEA